MAKPAAKKRKLEPAPHHTRKPRQQRLPGTEDAKIEELHGVAEDYAEIRDKRQALTGAEVQLKTTLLGLMHKHGKTKYHYNGLDIEVVPEDEKVRVRVKKEGDDAE